MKTAVALFALTILALPFAGRAFAKKYDEFQLKELREAREGRKQEKVQLQQEREDEAQKTQEREKQRVPPRHRLDAADAVESGTD
jgi:hypothetical protein